MNKQKRNTLIIVIISAIIITLVILKKKEVIGKTELSKVSCELIEKRNIIESVNASGKIHPEKEIIIAPDASGEIKGLHVKEGDSVIQKQLLLEINPDIYKSTLDKVKAGLNSSKANLASSKARQKQTESQLIKAESDFKRSESLYKKSVISLSEYETAKSQYEIALAEVEASKQNVQAAIYAVNNSEAALKEAQDNLTKTSVFSPINGTVSMLSKEVGERVTGASQFSAGTEIMRIANLNNMEAQVDVSENDIIRVHIGDTALIEVDAYLGRKFKGIVTQIANSANNSFGNTDQVTIFKVKIRILPSSYSDLIDKHNSNLSPFRPGMSASVEILTNYQYDIISAPIQSVTTREDTTSYRAIKSKKYKPKDDIKEETNVKTKTESNEYVFVYSDGKVYLRKVTIGIQDTDYYQILSGLEEGEEVVTAPYRSISKKLKNKQPVEKVEKEKLFVSE